jgi:hypothetical protein
MSVLRKPVLAVIAASLLFACEQPFKSGLGKKIDIESPRFITITPASGTYINGVAHFTGGVRDDLSVNTVEVQINNGRWEPVSKLTVTGGGTAGEFNFDFDTRPRNDGLVYLRFRVSDSKTFTLTQTMSYTIKNNPPRIKMTLPPIQDEAFDSASLNTGITLFQGNDIMGITSDAGGVAPGYPQIMLWPAGEAVGADGVPLDPKWGAWREVRLSSPRVNGEALYAGAFSWPLLDLANDGQGGWRLPEGGDPVVDLPTGVYRFRLRVRDESAVPITNTYPNRIDNGLQVPQELHPNQYIEFTLAAASGPIIRFMHDPANGKPFPAFYTGAGDCVVYLTVTGGNPPLAVKAKVSDSEQVDFSGAFTPANPLGGNHYAVTIPAADSCFASTGDKIMHIEAADRIGNVTTASKSFYLDNIPPEMTFFQPANFGSMANPPQVTSSVTIRGTTSDANRVVKLYYSLGKTQILNNIWNDTKLDTAAPLDNTGLQNESVRHKWSNSLSSWTWRFENIADFTMRAGDLPAAGIGNSFVEDHNSAYNLWMLPIKFRAVDAAGNEREYACKLILDPDADTPHVHISSHQNGAPVGGVVPLRGTAEDNEWIDRVEIRIKAQKSTQILDPANPASWDVSAWDILTANPVKYPNKTPDNFVPVNVTSEGMVVSWFFELNSDDSLTAVSGMSRGVQVEVRAGDADPGSYPPSFKHYGPAETLRLLFSPTVPTINASFYRGNTAGALAAPESEWEAFSAGTGRRLANEVTMRVKIRDDGGITGIRMKRQQDTAFGASILDHNTPGSAPWVVPPPLIQAGTANDTIRAGRHYFIKKLGSSNVAPFGGINTNQTSFTATSGGTFSGDGILVEANADSYQFFEYLVYVPLDTQTLWSSRYHNFAGTYSIDIQAEDNSSPSHFMAHSAITVNIDNYAPLASFSGNPNMAGVYSLSGRAWDTGRSSPLPLSSTGNNRNIDKVVVYFSRNGGGVSLWENHPAAASNPAAWVADQYAFEGRSGSEANGASLTGTLTQLPFFPNVKQGDGTWKSTNSGIVIKGRTSAAGDDGINGNNYDKEFSNDPVGLNYVQIWEVEFDTRRLESGPVTLHYVVFDTAGNASHYSQDLYVSNNRPDILGFKLGTDINGDGAVDTWISNAAPGEHSRNFTLLADGPGEITTNFTIRNNSFNIMLDTRNGSGNGQKYYKIAYVTESGPLPAGTMISGGVYKIAARGDTRFNFYGAGDNEPGTVFVASGPAPGSGAVFAYTEAAGTVKTGTMNASKNDILFDGKILNAIPDSIEAIHVKPDGTVNLQHNRLFMIKVYDTTVPGQGEDAQLACASLINLDINNHDKIKPLVSVDPFHWAGANDNSLVYDAANGAPLGHIELEADLPPAFTAAGTGVMDRDPKVSGKICIRGTAFDNNIIKSLWVKLDGFAFGGTQAAVSGSAAYTQAADYRAAVLAGIDQWKTDGWRMSVSTVSHNQEGHRIKWRLEIDTARHIPIAEADQTFRIAARDFAAVNPNDSTESSVQTTAAAKTPCYRMDIVPYISAIETPVRTAGGLKNNNIRSAAGKYAVMQNALNIIRVRGFNLSPAAADGGRILTQAQQNAYDPQAAAAGRPVASTASAGTAANTSYDFTNTGSPASGYFVIYTSGIGTLNNINNNDSAGSFVPASGTAGGTANTNNGYNEANMPNREADRYVTKNITLTDDRYLQFYTVVKTDVKNGYNPVMIMNGDNPVFGYIDTKGGPSAAPGTLPGTGAGTYQASHAMPQRSEFDFSSGARIYTEYLIKASIWDAMGMARDDSGRYIHATTYNRDGACLHLVYDRYAELYGNEGYGWGSGTAYANYTGNIAYNNNNNAIALETVNLNGLLLDRYQYPKLITRGNSRTAYASYYMSYYDNGTGQLIFRNFRIGNSAASVGVNKRQLANSGSDAAGNAYGSPYTSIEENGATGNTSWETGRQEVSASASGSFDMAVSSGNIAVIVYYDESAGKLVIKYSGSAVSGDDPGAQVVWIDSPANANLPAYTGMYVSMTMDAANGIHIAAFDAVDSDLKYIYIPDYTAQAAHSVTVDQYGSVGYWTDIKLHPADKRPYISYYNATETGGRDTIKLAFAKHPVTAPADVQPGVDAAGCTTGNWEYTAIPAIDPPQGGSSKFQKVNLGFTATAPEKPVLGYLGTNIEFGYPVNE